MQIFATSPDPREAAESLRHDVKRRGKMILESAQILCTALSPYCEVPYKPTHKNHPCVKWAEESKYNCFWLAEYAYELEKIRLQEGDNPHKSFKVIHDILTKIGNFLPYEKQTPFINCTPYKDMPVHEAYKRFLSEKQQNLF